MKNKNAILVFIGLFLMVVISRGVSHLWNLTMVGGAFLFAGAYFQDKKVSWILMLSSMLFSDYMIRFHDQMLGVYMGYLVVVLLGALLGTQAGRLKTLGFAALGSFAFYVITNFGVWFEGQLYPLTFTGFVDCYVMALPFYRNQFVSDLASTFIIFEAAKVLAPAFASEKSKA